MKNQPTNDRVISALLSEAVYYYLASAGSPASVAEPADALCIGTKQNADRETLQQSRLWLFPAPPISVGSTSTFGCLVPNLSS